MKDMKVVLLQDVRGQGKKGQLVNVSDGYARNYLFPKNLAVEANSANLNVMKTKDAAEQHRLAVEKAAAQEVADALKGKTVCLFQTHGGGGMQRVGKDFAEVIGDVAKVLPPKAFSGSSIKSSVAALEAFASERMAAK